MNYKILRKITTNNGYLEHRMQNMNGEVTYYMNLAKTAPNAALRAAYTDTATTYLKRYEYYAKKLIAQ